MRKGGVFFYFFFNFLLYMGMGVFRGVRMTDKLPAAGSCRVGVMSQRRINLPQQTAREVR